MSKGKLPKVRQKVFDLVFFPLVLFEFILLIPFAGLVVEGEYAKYQFSSLAYLGHVGLTFLLWEQAIAGAHPRIPWAIAKVPLSSSVSLSVY